jgi:hypothetical protein
MQYEIRHLPASPQYAMRACGCKERDLSSPDFITTIERATTTSAANRTKSRPTIPNKASISRKTNN